MPIERNERPAGVDEDADAGAPKGRGHAFDQLVLPAGHKQMVKSLIAQHLRGKRETTEDDDYSDIIRGKGERLPRNLEILTSRSLFFKSRVVSTFVYNPILQSFPNTHGAAGDLGVWASDVERALEQNFSLANRWGCILLLDEVDVFLAARTPTDTLRNGLDATLAIFDLNLARIKKKRAKSQRKINVRDAPIAVLASEYWRDYPKARWNGRQIRNACHTAAALAEFEAQGGDAEAPENSLAIINLEVKHFEKVAKAYLGFSEYLRSIYGVDADERAKENFLRAKHTEPVAAAAAQPLLLRRNETPPSRPRQSYGDYAPTSSQREPLNTRPSNISQRARGVAQLTVRPSLGLNRLPNPRSFAGLATTQR
ncbi:hypothetical protein PG994_002830 [Apiospora phragmitis]|uniref:AAA+ ATPase lid domain-containing protein n=1 Tax=Apiospora phragmitis TaxID=2905665 RepID=A0ABR1WA32_9PEZI